MAPAVTAVVEEVEVRCPVPLELPNGFCRPGRLLLKLRLSGQIPSYVYPDNLIELPCEDCRVRMRQRGVRVKRVLHRFDLAGTLVESLVDGESLLGGCSALYPRCRR